MYLGIIAKFYLLWESYPRDTMEVLEQNTRPQLAGGQCVTHDGRRHQRPKASARELSSENEPNGDFRTPIKI